MSKLPKTLFLLCFLLFAAVSFAESKMLLTLYNDSVTVYKIDSMIKAVKKKKTGIKTKTDTGSENYFYNKADGNLCAVAVYKSIITSGFSLTVYYLLKEDLIKVSYWEFSNKGKRKAKTPSSYYFNKGHVIEKSENSLLKEQNPESLLTDTETFKNKASHFKQ